MKITRRTALGLMGGGAAMLMTVGLPGRARASSLGAKRWIMSGDTFEAVFPQDPELAEAMAGVTVYATKEGETYGLDRVLSRYVHPRDVRVLEGWAAAGTIQQGSNVVFPIENNESDPEKDTPTYQQVHVGETCRRSLEACRSAGATFIASPNSTIADNVDPGWERRYENAAEVLIEKRVWARAARNSDGVAVQFQQSLQNLERYVPYVRDACNQVRGAVPGLPAYAGLTTQSPRARPDDYPSAEEIATAAFAVAGYCQGYWLNVPDHRETGERDFAKAHRALRICYGLGNP